MAFKFVNYIAHNRMRSLGWLNFLGGLLSMIDVSGNLSGNDIYQQVSQPWKGTRLLTALLQSSSRFTCSHNQMVQGYVTYFLVNCHEDSSSERFSVKWTVGREAKLRGQLWNFGDNISARYTTIYQQDGKGFIYFITLRIISQGERKQIVPAYFLDFFVFLGVELSTGFLFIRH